MAKHPIEPLCYRRWALIVLAAMPTAALGCDDNCLDHCPKPRALETCAVVAPLEADAVLTDAAALMGTTVAVRGKVGKGAELCTQLGCFDGCCNTCSAELVLRGSGAAGIVLHASGDELRCEGDDSRVCCPLAHDAVVVAQGKLVEDPGGVLGPTLTLEGAVVCAP